MATPLTLMTSLSVSLSLSLSLSSLWLSLSLSLSRCLSLSLSLPLYLPVFLCLSAFASAFASLHASSSTHRPPRLARNDNPRDAAHRRQPNYPAPQQPRGLGRAMCLLLFLPPPPVHGRHGGR